MKLGIMLEDTHSLPLHSEFQRFTYTGPKATQNKGGGVGRVRKSGVFTSRFGEAPKGGKMDMPKEGRKP